MFNPEKLLGGLLGQSMGASRGWGTKAGVGLGLLGVAMEAAEHFMNKSQTPAGPGAPPPAPPGAGSPPPIPQPGAFGKVPPPPPGAAPAPPPESQNLASQARDAVLLIRAMIAAAHADGHMDPQERDTILGKLEKLNLSSEERGFISNEIVSPATLETIADQVASPEMARQVYAVSLMAITVDTDAERDYMDRLARKLKLNPAQVGEIEQKLGQSA